MPAKLTHSVRQADPQLDKELRDITNVVNGLIDSLAVPSSSIPKDSSPSVIQAVNVRTNLYSLVVKTTDGQMYSLPGIFLKTNSTPKTAPLGAILVASQDGNFAITSPPTLNAVIGSVVLRVQDSTSYTYRETYQVHASFAGTGTNDLFTFTPPDTSAYLIEAHVVAGRTSTTAQTNGYVIRGVFRRDGGNPVLIGSAQQNMVVEDVVAGDCTVLVSGSTIVLRATGPDLNTWDWTATIDVYRSAQ